MPAEASPFPPRTYPTSKIFLYVDGIDWTPWAERNSLQIAAQEYMEGAVEQSTIMFKNYARPSWLAPGDPGAYLPALRAGSVPVICIERYGVGLEVYETIFSGVVNKRTFPNQTLSGHSSLSISTPVKELRTTLPAVLFYPGTEGNDVLRLRALGNKWGNPRFDLSLPGATVSITYPPPRPLSAEQDYIDGEVWTKYENRTVDDIVRDIMRDPGQAGDANYPVPNRDWWWEGRFKNDADPTQGVVFHLNMVHPLDRWAGPPLSDIIDPLHTDALLYDAGATLDIDYAAVVRRVQVKGDVRQTDPMAGKILPSGTTNAAHVGTPSQGWVRKIGGVNGAYDVTCVDDYVNFSDFDFHVQIQETYLAHDPFQGDDQPKLNRTSLWTTLDAGFPPGYWYHANLDLIEANSNHMGRKANKATPTKHTGPAIAYVEAKAATCIYRATVDHNVAGMACIVRATVDANGVLTSGLVLRNTGSAWVLVEFTSGTFGPPLNNTPNHATAENQRIKINCKYDQIQVYFDDVIDAAYTLENYVYNEDETLFGIGVWDDLGGNFWEGTFSDFSVTEFWGDKAAGIGDATTGVDWFWIGYGYVWNTNGTYTLVRGGAVVDTLGVGSYGQAGATYTFAALDAYQAANGGDMPADVPYLWEDILLAHDNYLEGFDYNDIYWMTTVLYDDTSTEVPVEYRKVQWWRQNGSVGVMVLLREELGLAFDIIHRVEQDPNVAGTEEHVVWYHQFALKELGATFTNIGSSDNYSNLFIPTGIIASTMTPLQGDYPATGVIEDARLNSYARRQKIADGVFRALAEPHINLQVTVHPTEVDVEGAIAPPYYRGNYAMVRNGPAGWIDNGVTDLRKQLLVRSIQRVQAGASGKRPEFRVRLGSQMYDLADPARSHMLQALEQSPTLNNPNIPEIQGSNFNFVAPVVGDQFFGVFIEMKVNAIGQSSGGDIPIFRWPSGTRSMQIPYGTFPPGTTYEAQHRTVAADGTTSPWSVKYSATMPPAPPYVRPLVLGFPLGDAVNVMTVPLNSTGSIEWPVNEACALTEWRIVTNLASSIELEIEWCSAEARQYTGTAAYASLTGTGQKPYTDLGVNAGLGNFSSDFRNWNVKHADIQAGDWLRATITVVGAGTLATLGTLTLTLERINR